MEIKIISFNIWDLPLWFVRDREQRFQALMDYIQTSPADIICLQEAFDPLHRLELKKRLSSDFHISDDLTNSRRIMYVKHFDASGGLVILSKFPIIESSFIPHNRFINVTIGEIFGRKGLLIATLQTPQGLLDVINVHLHEEAMWFVDKIIRRYQLKKIAAELRAEKRAAILCGDFNEHDVITQPIFAETIAAQGFSNPTADILEASYRTNNQYFNGLLNKPGISKRYDYIFIRHLETLDLRAVDYKRLLLTPPLSDHDPVSLSLQSV